ncbi:SusC/RagA family TonB-linked outer membrane protein [Parafilimonas sp.]|uniref:SusC/RagA family TonB-linked outer membrane protein n=1 Tax=Parafilimonas sp. TaxID=1969739 RepID=UPI0039E38275
MKLTAFLLTIFFVQAHAVGNTQRVTITGKDLKLKQVFSAVEKQTGYVFLSNRKTMEVAKLVTVKAKAMPLEKFLKEIFADQPLDYMIEGKTIVLSQKKQVVLSENKTGDSVAAKALAQSSPPIKIIVQDAATNSPLQGASVMNSRTKAGGSTDNNGIISLDGVEGDVIEISYTGYEKQKITIKGNSGEALVIKLMPSKNELDETVVVAYGTQKKVNLTGAVSSVSSKDLEWKPVGQTSLALQGAVPGLTITTTSGQPGFDQGTINIRGIGTLNDNSPLVLVDGVRYDEGLSLNDIDANDIASISVLKDAASASIYGVRAANGVILITTKRGQSGKAQVSYTNYFGWQSPARLAKYVGAQKFMEMANLMYENSGSGAIYTQDQIDAYSDPDRDVNIYPDNYWLKDILTGNGFQQQHSLSVNGGSDKVKYRFSTNYFDQNGLVQNMDFKRLTLRLNTDINVSGKLSFNADISGRFSGTQEPQGTAIGVDQGWYQFGQSAVVNPLTVNKYTDGTWGIVRGGNNPIRLQTEGGQNRYNENLFGANFRADFKPVNGLTISGIASGNYNASYHGYHTVALSYYTDYPNNTQTNTFGQNQVEKIYTGYSFQNYQGLVQYEKNLGKNYIKLLGGFSNLMENTNYLSGYRTSLPNSTLNEINAGAADGQQATGYSSAYSLVSAFGRLNYSYNDKYLLEANIRRDGSSRFPDGNKWGWFPSVSAGWKISSEDFFQNVNFIQELKLRGSWGKLGNDAIGNYPYQSSYTLNSYPFGGSLNTTTGLSAIPSTGLTWETTKMIDGGLDIAMFKKFNLTFDYYTKSTDDILLQLRIPESVGLSATYQNAGKVKNTGWELSVNYNDNIGKDFRYTVGVNLADVKNKIVDLKGTDYLTTNDNNITTAYKVGEPIGAYYGYIVDGIFQTQDEVDKHAVISSNVGPGDLIYRDIDGDGSFTDADKVYLGSNIPRYTYGINLSASYKGFDLGAFLQGVGKVTINTLVIEKAPTSTDGNFKTEHEDSWTPGNTDAAFPRLVTSQQNYQPSTFWVQSGAYLRLKSAQIGYTLPDAWIGKSFITKARIYASGQNLLTFSKLPHDIDPEAPNDSRYYPQVKIFTFGLNINF